MREDLTDELEVKRKVMGQAIPGGGPLIKWLNESFSPESKSRDCPGLNELKRYLALEEIMTIFSKETGKTLDEVKNKKHPLRPVLMDLLYRAGGLTGLEIGKIFNVGYSTVSQARKATGIENCKGSNFKENSRADRSKFVNFKELTLKL